MSEEAKHIAEQILLSWQGPAWHGPCLRELLSDVTEEVATRKPASGGHSIREIAQHIASWENAAMGAIGGTPMPDDSWPDDWPESGASWSVVSEELRFVTALLAERVRQMPSDQLDAVVPGREYSFRFLLNGIPQHNAYHGGQLALLRKHK
jgi:uncharacterized damage-inducible protein DinB